MKYFWGFYSPRNATREIRQNAVIFNSPSYVTVFNRKQNNDKERNFTFLHLYFLSFDLESFEIPGLGSTRAPHFTLDERILCDPSERIDLALSPRTGEETAKSITRNQIVNHDPCVICPIISYRIAFDPPTAPSVNS